MVMFPTRSLYAHTYVCKPEHHIAAFIPLLTFRHYECSLYHQRCLGTRHVYAKSTAHSRLFNVHWFSAFVHCFIPFHTPDRRIKPFGFCLAYWPFQYSSFRQFDTLNGVKDSLNTHSRWGRNLTLTCDGLETRFSFYELLGTPFVCCLWHVWDLLQGINSSSWSTYFKSTTILFTRKGQENHGTPILTQVLTVQLIL